VLTAKGVGKITLATG